MFYLNTKLDFCLFESSLGSLDLPLGVALTQARFSADERRHLTAVERTSRINQTFQSRYRDII
jgi:hypothetical protein